MVHVESSGTAEAAAVPTAESTRIRKGPAGLPIVHFAPELLLYS